jgi:hypothetical protein
MEDNKVFQCSSLECRLIIESLCTEQTRMIKENAEAYKSEKWTMLEQLKIKFKE